jgi:hypothetical protein
MKEFSRAHMPVFILAIFLIAGSVHLLGWYMQSLRPSNSAMIAPTTVSKTASNVPENTPSSEDATSTEPYQNPFQ